MMVYWWVQIFTHEFIDVVCLVWYLIGNCWFFDEMYVKVVGCWMYLFCVVDQYG